MFFFGQGGPRSTLYNAPQLWFSMMKGGEYERFIYIHFNQLGTLIISSIILWHDFNSSRLFYLVICRLIRVGWKFEGYTYHTDRLNTGNSIKELLIALQMVSDFHPRRFDLKIQSLPISNKKQIIGSS